MHCQSAQVAPVAVQNADLSVFHPIYEPRVVGDGSAADPSVSADPSGAADPSMKAAPGAEPSARAGGSVNATDPSVNAHPGAQPCRPARVGTAELMLAPAGAYVDAAVAPGGACRWQYVLAGRAVRYF